MITQTHRLVDGERQRDARSTTQIDAPKLCRRQRVEVQIQIVLGLQIVLIVQDTALHLAHQLAQHTQLAMLVVAVASTIARQEKHLHHSPLKPPATLSEGAPVCHIAQAHKFGSTPHLLEHTLQMVDARARGHHKSLTLCQHIARQQFGEIVVKVKHKSIF